MMNVQDGRVLYDIQGRGEEGMGVILSWLYIHWKLTYLLSVRSVLSQFVGEFTALYLAYSLGVHSILIECTWHTRWVYLAYSLGVLGKLIGCT